MFYMTENLLERQIWNALKKGKHHDRFPCIQQNVHSSYSTKEILYSLSLPKQTMQQKMQQSLADLKVSQLAKIYPAIQVVKGLVKKK